MVPATAVLVPPVGMREELDHHESNFSKESNFSDELRAHQR